MLNLNETHKHMRLTSFGVNLMRQLVLDGKPSSGSGIADGQRFFDEVTDFTELTPTSRNVARLAGALPNRKPLHFVGPKQGVARFNASKNLLGHFRNTMRHLNEHMKPGRGSFTHPAPFTCHRLGFDS